jgi:hypothetical protein
VVWRRLHYWIGPSPLEQGGREGETPVRLVLGASSKAFASDPSDLHPGFPRAIAHDPCQTIIVYVL